MIRGSTGIVASIIFALSVGAYGSWHYFYRAIEIYLGYEIQEIKKIVECSFLIEKPEVALTENLLLVRIIYLRYRANHIKHEEFQESYGVALTRIGLLYESLGEPEEAAHRLELADSILSETDYYLSFNDLKSALIYAREKSNASSDCANVRNSLKEIIQIEGNH